ncbi:MAG: tyrosine-type recombinase/integrase [Candidatus Poribacteria bacterium]|nr:tyrosine-type recombinase/integrase [Candidatus Poribacteria bacterium]
MQTLVHINQATDLQLTDEDKLRIGVAWDALSPNSRRAYQLAWRQLNEFLSAKGEALDNLTDTQLAAYLSILDTKGIAPATLSVCLAAVKWYFSNVKGQDVQFTISQKRLKTIKRDAKGRGRGQVDALIWADVERVCAFAEADKSIAGLRDSAMIRLMSDCLLRVSEVVAVNVGHFKQNTLIVQKSKTDQQGEGVALYVTSDTRNAISKYREKAGITRGALFRPIRRGGHIQTSRLTDVSARQIIKKRAAGAGVDGFISGHSLRVGSAVSLAKAGASVVDLQVAGRWKNSQMPAHYARAEMAERGAIARYKETDRSQV